MSSSDYVRVKRRNTTIFLYVNFTDTAPEVRAKINAVTKVPVNEIKLYLDSSGEVSLDENKTLAEQKVRRAREPQPHATRERGGSLAQVENDQEMFMVYKKEGALARPARDCPHPRLNARLCAHAGSDEWEAIELPPSADAAAS